jgi:hypothetical protein
VEAEQVLHPEGPADERMLAHGGHDDSIEASAP